MRPVTVWTMRQHTRRTPVVVLAVTALAGAVPVLPAAGLPGRPAAGLPARPVAQVQPGLSDSPYRVGFVSTSGPRLLRVDLEGEATAVAVDGLAQDAAARSGELVWIGFPVSDGLTDPDGELFWQDSSTPEIRQLTDDGFVDRNPALSPDGNQIAFESDRAGNVDIWVVGVDGTGLRQVTTDPAPDTGPTWSPDGAGIVYAGFGEDSAGDLYRIAAGGGEPQRLTDSPGADIQPAWSPADPDRITFTTTRFQELGDVVRMPVAGGPVERLVPDPWDSSEPSWSPNGERLAFITRLDDPQGDVYLLEDGVVTPLATEPGTPETGPSQENIGVFYTELGEGDGTFDVWSADRNGADRRDLTNRPALDETGPTWTADGHRLAYSEAQPDGGARIVVTGAGGDGRHVIAPPGTLSSDIDLDPSWSPDGSRLAFTRQRLDPVLGLVTSSTILVVRVADGAELGRLPVPPGTSALDGKPAWSPDGTRLAFERRSDEPQPPFVEQPPVDRPVDPSGEFSVDISVAAPLLPQHPDIMFLVDATDSMDGIIDDIQGQLFGISALLRLDAPTARFGIAVYRDLLQDPIPFQVVRPLTPRLSSPTLPGATGGGGSEDWINALHQLATGAVEFLPGRSPVVVLIGDAPSNEPSGEHQLTDPPKDPTGADGGTLAALRAGGIRVVAIDVPEGLGTGLDSDGGQASTVAARTGGGDLATLPDSADPIALREAIIGAIQAMPVSVVPEIESCDPGLSVSVDPGQREVQGGQFADFTAAVQVAGDAPAGARLSCVVAFQLSDGSRTSQQLTVRVNDGVRPQVRVDDQVVRTEDGSGAVVDYPASAVTASGIPLTPVCEPASGTQFPVGLTVVTCTATDFAGNTGTDTALVSVVDENSLGSAATRIWSAALDAAGPDPGPLTDQIDLRGRFESCTGADMLAPAWSPAGDELAYALVGEGSLLCVADPDTGEVRVFNPPSFDRVDDPAWSPDGELIAFGLSSFSNLSVDIWTVPAGGGEASLLIGGEGQQREPAFQVPIRRDPPGRPDPPDPPDPPPVSNLSVTVTVAPVPGFLGGDDLTVTFTVRNDSGVVLTQAELAPGLPGGLPLAAADQRCASPSSCPLGTLLPGAAVTRTFRLEPAVAARTVVSADVTAAPVIGPALSARDAAVIVVVAPELALLPVVGPPGSVPTASGVNFPPGARVRLTWRGIDGQQDTLPITTTGNELVVAPDGTLSWPALVLRKDVLGARQLVASPVDGPGFGETAADFLVVPRSLDPPEFEGRG